MRKDIRTGPVGGQVQADSPGVARHHGCNFEQLHAQRIHLSRGKGCAHQGQRTQPLNQHIAQCRQQSWGVGADQVAGTGLVDDNDGNVEPFGLLLSDGARLDVGGSAGRKR